MAYPALRTMSIFSFLQLQLFTSVHQQANTLERFCSDVALGAECLTTPRIDFANKTQERNVKCPSLTREDTSVVISRPWSPDSSALEFILSWSRDLKTQVSVLVSRQHVWCACSTITVIFSTFKRLLCHQLELMQPVMWSRDHCLETRVHSSSFCPGLSLGLGLET